MSEGKGTIDQGWERVLVRHVTPAKRNDASRLSSLLHAPFPSTSSSSCDGGSARDIPILGYPSGRWMMAARFTGESWVALFSNAATARQLFEANAASRRLEVAWVACRPLEKRWILRVNRGGKAVVDFAEGTESRRIWSEEIEADLRGERETGEEIFQRLCERFEITRPTREIRATEREFQLIGARGEPVKTGLHGYARINGPQIAEGENEAASDLAAAIERCDVKGTQRAIARGAPLHALPDSSVSPLQSALYRCDRPGWKECVELLLKEGCPVDGIPPDDPPILDSVQNFIPEDLALKMVELLVANGANVNATDRHGNTALFEAVVDGRIDLVRLLMRLGADPTIRTENGTSALEWLRTRLRENSDPVRRSRLAEMEELLQPKSG